MMNVRECLTLGVFATGAYVLGLVVGLSGGSQTEIALTAVGLVVLVFAICILGGYAHD